MSKLEKLVKRIKRVRGSDLNKVRYLNAWIYGSLALSVKNRTSDSVDDSFEQLNGACGHRDNMFREAAEALGWKSRRIGFHEVPIQLAHVATEVFVDGKWRFFDSTFGIYLADPGDPDNILSIEEARFNYPNVSAFQTNQAPYKGAWLSDVDLSVTQLSEPAIMHPFGDWVLAKIDETYFLSSLVIEIPEWQYISEMTVPLSPGDRLEFDEAQLASNHLDFPYGKTYIAYAHTLGKYWGRGPDIAKRISILTDTTMRVCVSLQTRHAPLQNIYANMRQAVSDYELDAMVIDKIIENQTITWTFQATAPMTVLNIRVSQGYSAVIEKFVIEARDSQAANGAVEASQV